MKLIFLLFSFCVVSTLIAQSGTVDCTDKIASEILKKDMPYSVYLPAGYHSSKRSYPVLYLLHGMTDDHTAWVTKGDAARIVSDCIAKGAAPEMIVIMPEGLFDAFYINNFDRSIRWEDFFINEFIPAIEKKYRILSQRKFRAIAGLSMGGYGATYHALKRPDLFSSCYAMSAAYVELSPLKPGEKEDDWMKAMSLKLWGPRTQDGLPANYKAHSIQEMVKKMSEYKKPEGPAAWTATPTVPRLVLDCGDDDFLIQQNLNLSQILRDKKIPFELRVRDGAHTWDYWRGILPDALAFASESFKN
jgi:S-formylglutathione hydrolase FrmB